MYPAPRPPGAVCIKGKNTTVKKVVEERVGEIERKEKEREIKIRVCETEST